jgi:hypothetical protein
MEMFSDKPEKSPGDISRELYGDSDLMGDPSPPPLSHAERAEEKVPHPLSRDAFEFEEDAQEAFLKASEVTATKQPLDMEAELARQRAELVEAGHPSVTPPAIGSDRTDKLMDQVAQMPDPAEAERFKVLADAASKLTGPRDYESMKARIEQWERKIARLPHPDVIAKMPTAPEDPGFGDAPPKVDAGTAGDRAVREGLNSRMETSTKRLDDVIRRLDDIRTFFHDAPMTAPGPDSYYVEGNIPDYMQRANEIGGKLGQVEDLLTEIESWL